MLRKESHILQTDMSAEYQEDISRKYWKYARWDKDIERERKKTPERLWVGDKTRKTEVPVDQIIFVQTIKGKHSVEIYSTEKSFIARKTIKEMKELLGKEFILISNFCIISKRNIRGVDAANRTVSLTNGYECGISKRHVQEVMGLCEEGK